MKLPHFFSNLTFFFFWVIFEFLGHNYIGTEHLLLGLLCEGEGVAARALENMGADPIYIWDLVK